MLKPQSYIYVNNPNCFLRLFGTKNIPIKILDGIFFMTSGIFKSSEMIPVSGLTSFIGMN